MKLNPYVIRSGDYLAKIAHHHGFDADEVWNHPSNADLKRQRDPNQLHPGDLLQIPEPVLAYLSLSAGTDNAYVATVPTTSVSLSFEAFPNEAYTVSGVPEEIKGTTDAKGKLALKVPVNIHEVRIAFPKRNVICPVHVGGMDPVDEDSGVRKRLQHLGFRQSDAASAHLGDEEEQLHDQHAIQLFQRANGLEPTGKMDDATKAKLVAAHGS